MSIPTSCCRPIYRATGDQEKVLVWEVTAGFNSDNLPGRSFPLSGWRSGWPRPISEPSPHQSSQKSRGWGQTPENQWRRDRARHLQRIQWRGEEKKFISLSAWLTGADKSKRRGQTIGWVEPGRKIFLDILSIHVPGATEHIQRPRQDFGTLPLWHCFTFSTNDNGRTEDDDPQIYPKRWSRKWPQYSRVWLGGNLQLGISQRSRFEFLDSNGGRRTEEEEVLVEGMKIFKKNWRNLKKFEEKLKKNGWKPKKWRKKVSRNEVAG